MVGGACFRSACEHEAAHTVVALHYGLTVTSVTASRSGSGSTKVEWGGATRAERAAACCAGDLWEREFSDLPYVDGACSDLRLLEGSVGAGGAWQAYRDARSVLRRQEAAVLTVADKLQAHGRLEVVRGRLVPATRSALMR